MSSEEMQPAPSAAGLCGLALGRGEEAILCCGRSAEARRAWPGRRGPQGGRVIVGGCRRRGFHPYAAYRPAGVPPRPRRPVLGTASPGACHGLLWGARPAKRWQQNVVRGSGRRGRVGAPKLPAKAPSNSGREAQPLRRWWVVQRAATTNGDCIMITLTRLRLIGAAALLSSAAALTAVAQTQT